MSLTILGAPTVTADVATAWALGKGAPPVARDVVERYWVDAPTLGIRPEVALAQSAHETGWWRWPGNSSPWAMAGIKVADPPNKAWPDAPENHERPADLTTGVRQHLAHLAVYAGVEPPPQWCAPRTNLPWFRAQYTGIASTVAELGARWAPASTYGTSVERLALELISLAPVAPREASLLDGLVLITRTEIGWGRTAAQAIDPKRLQDFAVHYSTGRTLGPHSDTVPKIVQWWRNIRDYHVNQRGYRDVAYNWAVARYPGDSERAIILEGRGDGRVGGHTSGANSTAAAVCFLGGDDPAVWDTTPGIARAINAIIALRELFVLRGPHRFIGGHQQFPGNSTSCPGGELMRWLAQGRLANPYPGASSAPDFERVPVPPPPTPTDLPVLRFDDRGEHVALLQERLVVHGWGPLLGPVDGVFGPRTRDVVRHHQHAWGIQVDGIVGPLTWATLL